MKQKTIWITLAFVLLILAGGFLYVNYRGRTLSPPGKAELAGENLTISISYSRPSVRNRTIFGTADEGALQPYGKYWRLGANESTEVTFSRDVTVNGTEIKAGTYRIYAIPQEDSFEVALNTETGKWGAFEPDYSLDVMRTRIPIEKLSSPVEQFTISLVQAGNGIDMIFEWADRRFVVPVR
jgi:Protein of unknown function (DUF2911).